MATFYEQKRIDTAIANRNKRDGETKLSISICWAINNAVASLPKDLDDRERHEWITTEMDWFLELYHDKMMDLTPEEIIEEKPAYQKSNRGWESKTDHEETVGEEQRFNNKEREKYGKQHW